MSGKIDIDNIPKALRRIPQWVGWRFVAGKPGTKPRKVPVNPRTDREAKTNEPATWGTFEEAVSAEKRFKLNGVGFVFVEGGGLTGVDFDECIRDGKMTPEAQAMVRELNSYTEISPSGTGVKVIVGGAKPPGTRCQVKNVPGCSRVEVYDKARFFTVTGKCWPGPAKVEKRQVELTALCAKLWPAPTINPASLVTPMSEPVVGVDNRVERCRRYLGTLEDAVSGQGGSKQTLRAACECFRFGLPDGDALTMLQWFNETKCKPVWSGREIARKLDHAKKKVEDAGEVGVRLRERSSAHGKGGEVLPVAGKSVSAAGGKAPWHNPLPGWIHALDRKLLRTRKLAILQTIASRCDKKPIDGHGSLGHAIIGFDGLAEETGMGRRTVIKHVAELLSMGLLVKMETGGVNWHTGECRANVYAIPGAEGIKIRQGGAKSALPHTPNTGLLGGVPNLHSLALQRK